MKKLLLILFIFISVIGYAQYQNYNINPNYTNHNRVNTCKNLLQKYTLDELSAMISSGNFDDIYVGDYMEVPLNLPGGKMNVRWLVAAINYFKNKTDVEIKTNHIVLVAESCFDSIANMNSSNTTSGGFASSSLYIRGLNSYNTSLINAFGSNHVLEYHQLLTVQTNTTATSMAGNNEVGCSSSREWATGAEGYPQVTKLCLMNECQLFGTKCCSSSHYDIGINAVQFPLFAQIPELIVTGRGFNNYYAYSAYWLTNVFSTTSFAICTFEGKISSSNASEYQGLRPYFLFY
ncbi:hypothetical protein J6W34_04680 [bacterium]|nr:hypothetical protein [bacterium]